MSCASRAAATPATRPRCSACCVAVARGVGAHPSYPDREGFGRRTIEMALPDVTATIAEQCARLARARDRRVASSRTARSITTRTRACALAAARARRRDARARRRRHRDRTAARRLREAADAAGLRYLREGFADRAVRPDGSLVPRSEPGALVTDPAAAAARARELAADHDTVCIHADTPGSLAIARAVRDAVDRLREARDGGRVGSARRSGDPVCAAAAACRRARSCARCARGPARRCRRRARRCRGVLRERAARRSRRSSRRSPTLPDDDTPRARSRAARDVHRRGPRRSRARDGPVDAPRSSRATPRRRTPSTRSASRPGFAYLVGLDQRSCCRAARRPGRACPPARSRSPIAFTAVYPSESPGGWHLIGRVADEMFGPHGARLQLGDRVRFRR